MVLTCSRTTSWSLALLSLLVVLLSLNVQEASAQSTRWIQYTGNDGTVWLNDNRRPSLYTQDFGDCMSGSLIDVSRFDGAYYKDNMTVLFHLEGSSLLNNQSVMSEFEVSAIMVLSLG
jgi:hypothetical protein